MHHHTFKAANSTPRLQQDCISHCKKNIEYMSNTLNSFSSLTINISKVKIVLLIAMQFLLFNSESNNLWIMNINLKNTQQWYVQTHELYICGRLWRYKITPTSCKHFELCWLSYFRSIWDIALHLHFYVLIAVFYIIEWL